MAQNENDGLKQHQAELQRIMEIWLGARPGSEQRLAEVKTISDAAFCISYVYNVASPCVGLLCKALMETENWKN